MSATDKVFAGSIPKLYDEYLVPLIFSVYADDIARRVAALSPTVLLETAAGTGAVTRAVAAALPRDVRYIATDLNEPMLAVAAQRQGEDDRISWRQADATALPFDDATFDVVCCQFGAMFFPDRIKGYAEAKRVLRPDGAFVFNVWDRIEDNVFAHDATIALGKMFPDDPPRFMARTPHGYHDKTAIKADLEQAGFGHISIETLSAVSRAPTPDYVAIAYCQGTPLRSEIEARDAGKLQAATEAVAEAIRMRHGPGPVEAGIQALVITARP
ncbi:SAM-dependent methyltransferase [Bradyrhizobium sp. LTSP849]|jgi:ubiquinone/menaquinone biosynthesis C-methylase UbiE|uniref:class I SAM-dependent methyltransferase n=1 Tax=unclassified Bradyrhizobium TaxID=2631580 RepID=UPI0005D2643C|nr:MULTISPECIES: methyltransferase domain-containing protein [unclassified Bradyrhizobium]KJC36354.1 SAM-dependent methyltransferase [Bradyrhizobium sp. LTSP849]KJC53317.1 SAM-dependent methyltransferase [Bradyrhizobium sp. LTSP857]